MKKSWLIGLGVVVMLVGSIAIFMVSSYNAFITAENGIVASHEDMQNVHASIFNSIKSQGLVVDKYNDMVIKALNAGMSGRYGPDGVKGAMLWIKEQNPSIDPQVYNKLQVAIEAGYARFESAQRTKIDKIRVYNNVREGYFRSWAARHYGFPRKVTPDMLITVTSAETEEMMQTKKMKTIDPFAK